MDDLDKLEQEYPKAFYDEPKYLSKLYILPGKDPGLTINNVKPKPNLWWRFWQWLLLGWEWEDVREE